ncbi:hypothetical protein N9137_01650 [Pseudomonadales bacterium]|nr:hypothetical protein [Pseudomonadales bacterium]MDB4431073.1 hypothetical protein [Pseudomonadales bacterium]
MRNQLAYFYEPSTCPRTLRQPKPVSLIHGFEVALPEAQQKRMLQAASFKDPRSSRDRRQRHSEQPSPRKDRRQSNRRSANLLDHDWWIHRTY